MTLVISIIAQDRYLQISDRKLTDLEGNSIEDPANKMIAVECVGAEFVIGYSGIATFYLEERSVRPDEWLFDCYTRNKLWNERVDGLLRILALELEIQTRSPNRKGRVRGITFGIAGRCLNKTFCGWVSNGTVNGYNLEGPCSYKFSGTYWTRSPSLKKARAILALNGSCKSVRDFVRAKFNALNRELFFSEAPNTAIVAEMVSWLREASDLKEAGNGIGKDCMSMSTGVGQEKQFIYHPKEGGPELFGPYILGPGVSFGDIRLWASPHPPPWW